jgi:hypothetical protein
VAGEVNANVTGADRAVSTPRFTLTDLVDGVVVAEASTRPTFGALA